VLCHPHPQHGGTLDNKVVQTLARAFVQLGYTALRFNFRGVGASAGRLGSKAGRDRRRAGRGQRASAPRASRWCWPVFPSAAMWPRNAAARLPADGTPAERLVLVAPPASRFAPWPRCRPTRW
jgi:uncharacterized protein